MSEKSEQQKFETEEQLEVAIASYYDSISDEERDENRAWAVFGESQISAEEDHYLLSRDCAEAET